MNGLTTPGRADLSTLAPSALRMTPPATHFHLPGVPDRASATVEKSALMAAPRPMQVSITRFEEVFHAKLGD